MLTTLAALVLLGQIDRPETAPRDFKWFKEPTLVAKGKGYLIHAVQGTHPYYQFARHHPPTMTIFVMDTKTGTMKPLLATGHESRRTGPGPRDIVWYETRLLGIATDNERLYALLFSMSYKGSNSTYLKVYNLVDGKPLYTLPVKEADTPPQPLPPESTESGPLKLQPNGVSCHGKTFTFKGKKLLDATAERKPKVEPPGRLFELGWEGPTLVSRGKGFLVHSMVTRPTLVTWMTPLEDITQGMVVFFTSTDTGKRKLLITSSTAVQTARSFGFGSVNYSRRILGFAKDNERLYVVTRQCEQSAPAYSLQVFSTADGALLHSLGMKDGDFPKEEEPPETTKAGPLVVKENGVSCYGVTFTFKGIDLLEQRYEKKP